MPRKALEISSRAVTAVVLGLMAALLPYPERDDFSRRHSIDPGIYSLLLGTVQAVGGVLGVVFGGLAWIQGTVGTQSMFLLSRWFPGLNNTHLMGVGLLNGLAWLLHPYCWILLSISLTGAVRLAAFVAAGHAVGEPLVWLGLRLVQAGTRGRRKLRRTRELGPLRADRFHHDAKGRLVIVTSRDRPDWTSTITLLFDEEFYRLIDRATIRDGAHHAVRYVFEPIPETALIRGLRPYQATEVVCR